MRQEGYPELAPVAEMGPQEYITALYRGIGWDGASDLDPRKVTISQQRWLDVCKQFNELPGPGIGGYLWMSYGPAASDDVPYNSVQIEPGAFHEIDMGKVLSEDRASIDKAVQSMFWVGDGDVIELDADPGADGSSLLNRAYDYRHMEPDDFVGAMEMDIYEEWMVPIDMNVDYVVEEAGIQPYETERYNAARDYLADEYEFRPPCDELLGQEARVNILLGTPEERDSDFSSIHDMCIGIDEPDAVYGDEKDNALTWLAEQQGYSYDSIADAVSCQESCGFDACLDTFGPFLASASSELANFPNAMGTIAVLTRIPIADIPKLNAPGYQITVPQGAKVGIFAPWVGGGSMLGIELEKPLAIPTEMVFETQVEGVRCDAFTVNQVYGLADDAWKRPVAIETADRGKDRPLDDLVREAKQKAAERNVARDRNPQTRRPSEPER